MIRNHDSDNISGHVNVGDSLAVVARLARRIVHVAVVGVDILSHCGHSRASSGG